MRLFRGLMIFCIILFISISNTLKAEEIEEYYGAGQKYYGAKDFIAAAREFEKAVDLDAEYKMAAKYFILSNLSLIKEELEAEIKDKKEKQQKARDQALEKILSEEAIEEDIETLAVEELNMKEKLKKLYEAAKLHYRQEAYAEAINEFEEIIDLDADYKDSARYLVYSYQALAKEDLEAEIQKKKEAQKRDRKTAEETKFQAIKEKEIKEKETTIAKKREYRIGEEDELSISVWGWNDLKVDAIVRPDGKISFPLIGDVQAVGLTLTEIDHRITEMLKSYIRAPDVSIMLRKIGGNKVIVLGEVSSPGVYKVSGDNTVLEVIALAGGFKEDAVLSSVIVIKGGLRNPEGKRINLSRAIDRTDMSQNITLEPEDIVYVPKKFIANVNYALRQILGPISQGAGTVDAIED